MLARNAPDGLERLDAGVREMQVVGAPILRVVAPLDEALLLQLVDERDQAAGADAEPRAQRTLLDARVEGDHPDHTGMRRGGGPPRDLARTPHRRARAGVSRET